MTVNLVPCPHGGRCGRPNHIAGSAAYNQCLARSQGDHSTDVNRIVGSPVAEAPRTVGELFGDPAYSIGNSTVGWSFKGYDNEKVQVRMMYEDDGSLILGVSIDANNLPGRFGRTAPDDDRFRQAMADQGLAPGRDGLFEDDSAQGQYVMYLECDPDILQDEAEDEAQNLYMTARERASDAWDDYRNGR